MKTATEGAAMADTLSPQGGAAGMGRLRREGWVGELLHGEDEQGSIVVNCGWRISIDTLEQSSVEVQNWLRNYIPTHWARLPVLFFPFNICDGIRNLL